MEWILIRKRVNHKLGNFFYKIARFFWNIAIVCNYCGKDGGFQDSVVSRYGFTCWKCKERLDKEGV